MVEVPDRLGLHRDLQRRHRHPQPTKQIRTPSGLRGKSFTAQTGKPDPSGTINARTYKGCKVADWEITIAKGEKAALSPTIDAWDEDDAFALVTLTAYVAANPMWTFLDASVFKIGQPGVGGTTVSTASGETSVTWGTGTAVGSVTTSLSIKGTNKPATERFGVGNAGVKREQLQNDLTEISLDFEGEYNPAQLENPFRQGKTICVQIDLASADYITGTTPYLLSFIVPAAKITDHPVEIDGADLVSVKGSAKVYKDAANPAIQVKIRNTDTAV